jgi:flagellar hook-basal body complex protein FliE
MSTPLNNVSRLVPGLIERVSPKTTVEPKKADNAEEGNFGQLLSDFVNSVNDLHHESGQIQEDFLACEPVELHQVMVKAEEAGVATELLIEIRNKLIDAYSELMRMPV